MNEVKNVYEKLKEMSLQSKTVDEGKLSNQTNRQTKDPFLIIAEEDETGYLTPRQLDSTYKRCPTPKPFNPNYPSPTYDQSPTAGYMSMNSVPGNTQISLLLNKIN